MNVNAVYKDLIRFSSYAAPIDLSFNQYLLLAPNSVLIHTGNVNIARGLTQQLKEALQGRELAYIYASHFEADECGGLGVILEAFPKARVLCSEVTARQLNGFGLSGDVLPQRNTDKLATDDYELEFITYPSEMHLWDGLLLVENKRKILFSSDLVLRHGEVKEAAIDDDIYNELSSISHDQIPDEAKRQTLIQALQKRDIDFIATGHGICVKKGPVK